MSQKERSIFWEVIVSVILSKKVYMYLCSILNGFQDRAISLHRSLDLAPNIVLPSCCTAPLYEACESVWSVSWLLWLQIVTLCKMPHIFTNAEYADMLYVYGFCDGSATAGAAEYHRRFPMCSIPDHTVFSKVFNTSCKCGTLPSAHVSSELACQQHLEEQENISVFHEHVYGEHWMKMACTHFTHTVCKIYTQGTVPCILNFVNDYIVVTNWF